MANRALKKIAARAGIGENLTTHIAHYSFALHGLKNKVDLEILIEICTDKIGILDTEIVDVGFAISTIMPQLG